MRVRGVNGPPVVDQDVKDREDHHQEERRPFRFETNGHHDTSDQTDEWDQTSDDGKLSRDDEAKEEKDQEDTTSKLKVRPTFDLSPNRIR